MQLITCTYVYILGTGCTVDISKDLGQPSPLLIQPGTVNSVRAINAKGTLSFSVGQKILFACPGIDNYIKIKGSTIQETIGTCVEGHQFLVNNTKFNSYQISCQRVSFYFNLKNN